MVQKLSDLYDANFKKVRGKAAEGFIRPTVGEYFVTHKDFVEVSSGLKLGDRVIFNDSYTKYISAVGVGNNKIVVAFQNDTTADYGNAVVGEMSGNSISFGDPVVFNSAGTIGVSITYNSVDNKVIISYNDKGNSYYGTSIVGEVSGNSISFGSPTVFGSYNTQYISSAFSTASNKVIISYSTYGEHGYGEVVIGTVSGNSISFSDPVVFVETEIDDTSVVYDDVYDQVLISYKTDIISDTMGYTVIGNISGDSISFGNPITFHSSNLYHIKSFYISSKNYLIISYGSSSSSGHVVIGEVSDGTIVFLEPAIFNDSGIPRHISLSYDTNHNLLLVSYQDYVDASKGKIIFGEIGENGLVTFGDTTTFNDTITEYNTLIYNDSSNKSVLFFQDEGNNNYGNAVVIY